LPTSVQTGAKQAASVRSPSSLGGRDAAAARHPEGRDLGVLEGLVLEQREELELLGVGRREAGLDQVDAERVQGAGDADLLGGAERHAEALHAVAQGGVVELEVGHGGAG
jgi:hypothetical protein